MELGYNKRSKFGCFLKYLSCYPERFLLPILAAVISFSILAPSILAPSYSLSGADKISGASEGCTFTSSVTSAHTKTINPGTTQSGIGTTKITTKCVNSLDHQVYAIGYSNDTDGNTNLINSTSNATIATGTTTSGNVSNWAMLIAKDSSSYLPANLSILNSFGSYHAVPSSTTQISSYTGGTDSTTGSSITTTYRAKISDNQTAGSYVGKVKYTLTATMVYSVTIKTVAGISKVALNGVECTSTSGCVINNLTEGESYTLVATLATGYNFASWNAGANGSVASATSASTTYTVGGGDSEITPTTTPKTYKITLNGNGATTAGSASTTATYSSSTLTAITRPQRKYIISGFTLPDSNNASSATVSSTSTLTSTYTFNGWYKESSATNKIASNAATPVLLASTSYTNGNAEWTYNGTRTLYAGWSSQAKTLPTITKTGYTCGWTETATDATTKDFQTGESLTPTRDYTLYGVCIPIDYTITIDAGAGTTALTLSGWSGTGTATLTKTFHIGDTIDLSAITPTYRTGHSGATYVANDSYGSISGSTYTVGAGNGNITIKASALDIPTCTMQGGTTKVYNLSATTLTATDTSSLYEANSVDITYSFGYATAADGTLGDFGTAQTGNTLSIAKAAFYGARYYGVTVNVTSVDDSTLTATCTSGTGSSTGTTVANRTTMTLVNSRVQLNANGGTLSGTAYFYVAYGKANKYSSRTATTTYTLPTVTPPSDYTFEGWYTAAEGGSKVMNADFSLTGTAVSDWSNASSVWVKTGTSNSNTATSNLLYAHYNSTVPNIQNLTSSLCTTTASQAKDTRDNHIYTIQRLSDGNCWMMENLDLGRTNLTTNLTSSNTNLATTITASTFNGWKKTTGSATYDAGEYISVSGADSSSGTSYGTLYNYYAASAGTIIGSGNRIDAKYDICPAGWRLPTGGESGKFQTLYSYYNSSALMRSSIENSGAAFALAGYFGSGSPTGQGTEGNYWSSTRDGDNTMHHMYLTTTSVSTGGDYFRNYGFSIRCVLDEAVTISDLTYMQDFKNLSDDDFITVFASMADNTTYNLIDNRDNKIYAIAKTKDGNIWMTENLDLGRTTLVTDLTSSNTNLSTTITASTFNGWKKTTGSATYNAGEYISTSGTDSTSGTPYGTLYNYYAASAGTISGSSNSNNASYDICPAGWRLPTDREFRSLYEKYDSNSLMRSPIANGGAAFALAGYFGSGSPTGQGTEGNYWSSTRHGDNTMHHMYLTTTSVSTGGGYYRNYGFSIRCVVDYKTISDLTYMQDFKNLSNDDFSTVFASMADSTTYNLIDSRDNKTYAVAKMMDGNIWMTENLDLGRTTLVTDLTSSNTNLSTTITASTFNGWKKTTGSATYNAGEYISTSGTDSTSGTPYGTLYNYYAASAGTISGSSNSNNASYDICPAGWRLPTHATEEFHHLNYQYNSYVLMRSPIANGGAAFALAGYFGSGSPTGQGTEGYYWSSTADNQSNRVGLTLSTSDNSISTYFNRNNGYAIRCVVK